MEAVHPLKVVHKNFVSTVSSDYLKETVSLGLNALEGERRFYYLGEDGQVELIHGSVAWVDYSEILSMAYGVWVGEATPESTGVILVKCLVQGMRTQGDEKRISRLERILVKITKRQPGQVDGYIQAPAILQPAIDAIWTALSPRAMTPDNPIGEMTAGDQAGEMQSSSLDLPAEPPAWSNEKWYMDLNIEWRERYDRLAPYRSDWESGKITDGDLAKVFGKAIDTIRGWRRELRSKKAPGMDWQKQSGA